jgi:hypothetical protein
VNILSHSLLSIGYIGFGFAQRALFVGHDLSATGDFEKTKLSWIRNVPKSIRDSFLLHQILWRNIVVKLYFIHPNAAHTFYHLRVMYSSLFFMYICRNLNYCCDDS